MRWTVIPTVCILAACSRGEQSSNYAAGQSTAQTTNAASPAPAEQAPTIPAAPPADQLTEADKTSIVQGAIQVLQQRGTVVTACAPYLALTGGRVIDSSINGSTGSAVVELQVAATPNFNENVRADYLNDCYGVPPGGLHPGVSFRSDWQVEIARWQSGWRVNPAGSFTSVVR